MEELGIPVDFISGTSIGSFIGGLYAMKTDTLLMHRELNDFVTSMSSSWEKISDLTLPVTSYFTGTNFNRGLVRIFGSTKIEDFWLPYICMSTDLTDSVEIAHRNGAAWRYIRASMTLVNLMPPICDVVEEAIDEEQESRLERLGALAPKGSKSEQPARKKSSGDSGSEGEASDGSGPVFVDPADDDDADLAEALPPARPGNECPASKEAAASHAQGTAPNDSPRKTRKVVHYLADGGYLNNLPVDRTREFLGPKATVIAVDVQGSWKFAGHNYGDSLSGWRYLFQWLNPFVETPNIPTSGDIQTQLAYISSVKQGSTAPQGGGRTASVYWNGLGGLEPPQYQDLRGITDLYLYPPVDDVTTLEFFKSQDIQSRSYEYAREKVADWLEDLRRSDLAKSRVLLWSSVSSQRAKHSKPQFGRKNPARYSVLHRSNSWALPGPTSPLTALSS